MKLLTKAEPEMAYAKIGLLGFAGAGKTFTAGLIAAALANQVGAKQIAWVDTETGSDFLLKMFEEAGLEVFRSKSRAFGDLLTVIKECEESGVQILIVDSITAIWRDLCDAYDKKLKRGGRLQFQDWAILKYEWRQYTDAFVNAPVHILVCGRAGYEYDYDFNADGTKDLIKTGTRMKVETEFGFEPSLVIEMERITESQAQLEEARGDKKKKAAYKPKIGSKWIHRAHVLKDRADVIDGQVFDDPTFENFLPHFEALNLGGKHIGLDTSRDSSDRFDVEGRPDWKRRQAERGIALEEIQNGLVELYPSTSGRDKQYKLKALKEFFGSSSWKRAEEKVPLEELKKTAMAMEPFARIFTERCEEEDFQSLKPEAQIHEAWEAALAEAELDESSPMF